MSIQPDIEAIFEFILKKEVHDGYRPSHMVKENCLTTGLHHYYKDKNIDGEVKGTITFITPEEYPACLWIGKKIEMFDGSKLIGYATVLKIFNAVLNRD